MALDINSHSVILFQGDSITDAGRSRWNIGPNHPDGLGYGYPRLIVSQMLKKAPDHYYQFYNRGISGDRIQGMARRWQTDTLLLQPDLISILIGINDTWNYIYTGIGSSPQEYQNIYQQLLEETRKDLPETRFVLCEPFVLFIGEVNENWMNDLQQRQEAVRGLAEEYHGVFVPFQKVLNAAARNTPAHQLLDDGVHPTEKGHQILAECWLEAVLG
jgi:lysophospholipase L1-like esterase